MSDNNMKKLREGERKEKRDRFRNKINQFTYTYLQKETEEDFRKMKQESQERITAILGCIQMRIRFEEKEEEWSAILKGFRDPLIKIVTSQYALQDEVTFLIKKFEQKTGCSVLFQRSFFSSDGKLKMKKKHRKI